MTRMTRQKYNITSPKGEKETTQTQASKPPQDEQTNLVAELTFQEVLVSSQNFTWKSL